MKIKWKIYNYVMLLLRFLARNNIISWETAKFLIARGMIFLASNHKELDGVEKFIEVVIFEKA